MGRSVTQSIAAAALVLLVGLRPAADGPRPGREIRAPQNDARSALVAAAVKEGSLSYWDTVVQPRTNDALVAGFRSYYGLPASFAVHYSLAQGVDLMTRVEQEVGTRRVSMDVVSVAALPWVYEKIRLGQVMRYDSPEYPFYRAAFK